MDRAVVVGCGVVGAAIAYELSQVPGLSVTVLDRQPPARASTGAALGVLMGVISQKVKGRAWALRHRSLRLYEQWLPELEALTGQHVPVNRQGVLLLWFDEDLAKWHTLVEMRQSQGLSLECWTPAQVGDRCPHLDLSCLTAGIYSPEDRQMDPAALTQALVAGAARCGVEFDFECEVQSLKFADTAEQRCTGVTTAKGDRPADWVIVASGLGTTPLLQQVQPLEIRPVLGQAMRVRLPEPLGDRTFQPVITGDDIHLVPLGGGEYWIGATVEFSGEAEAQAIAADPALLERVRQGAIAFCPALSHAEVVHTWSGLRPRPANRPAPVLERLPHRPNVILATGHYRNGVLLAPATAEWVKAEIVKASGLES